MITLKTRCNLNGNSYGAEIDTEKKTIKAGFCLVIGADIITTKTVIKDFIKALKKEGFKEI